MTRIPYGRGRTVKEEPYALSRHVAFATELAPLLLLVDRTHVGRVSRSIRLDIKVVNNVDALESRRLPTACFCSQPVAKAADETSNRWIGEH